MTRLGCCAGDASADAIGIFVFRRAALCLVT